MAITYAPYLFVRSIGSILVLSVTVLLMGGRAMTERQVRRDVSDLEEAKRQWKLT